jgi:arsenic resistance protein ArsH
MSSNMEIDHHTSTEAIPAEPLAVVVFGLDDKNRPHASAFASGEFELAEKAASLMNFNVFKPDTDEQRAFASQLPRGRIFGSGKAFVPFVTSGDYERLCAFAGVSAAHPAVTSKNAPAGAPSQDNVVPLVDKAKLAESPKPLGSSITLGSIVLACETDDRGFYEADRSLQLLRAGGGDGHCPVWLSIGRCARNGRRRPHRGAGDAIGGQDSKGVAGLVRARSHSMRLRELSDPDRLPALDPRYAIERPGLDLGPLDHPPRILLFYGSLRPRSFSRLATEEAARLLRFFGAEVRIFDPSDMPFPDQVKGDDHPAIHELRELSLWSEGQVWCSPERHGQISGLMKAQIDNLPLGALRPTQGRTLAVMQVSGGSQSFNAVNTLRLLGRWMRMFTIPNQSSVAKAYKEFDADGRMKPCRTTTGSWTRWRSSCASQC